MVGPPHRLGFAGVNSRRTAGGARRPDGILGDSQNSVRHNEQRGGFSPAAFRNTHRISAEAGLLGATSGWLAAVR